MATHPFINRLCVAAACIALAIVLGLAAARNMGLLRGADSGDYADTLFDTSFVHTIDIEMENWDEFLQTCENEEYAPCTVTIDGERMENVAIRAKGNTSLRSVAAYGNDRYSFKIEFDQYQFGTSYHGLDKLCLNNNIQDNTYMKDYLTYEWMRDMEVPAPLCSYMYVTVNGADWGLYLAVEAVEQSFLRRNYGKGYGDLYKPDSMEMGGGRGNGQFFDFNDFLENSDSTADGESAALTQPPADGRPPARTADSAQPPAMPDGATPPGSAPEGTAPPTPPENGGAPSGGGFGGMGGGFGGGSDAVALRYIDGDADSYSAIFDNAKTNVTAADRERLIDALKRLSDGTAPEDTVDTESVLRYFAVHNFVCNFDSYTGSLLHNYYLYEKDGILSMIPWDYNLAFGGFGGGSASEMVNFPIDTPVSGGSVEDRPMLSWIFSDENYKSDYHRYLSAFIEAFDETEIESVRALIAPYVERDPTKFCGYDEFEAGVTALSRFCTLRVESVRGQLDGTIPADSDGQSADPTALIETGDLSLSDMGTMGGGFGGGTAPNGARPFGGTPPSSDGTSSININPPEGGAPSTDTPSADAPSADMPSADAPASPNAAPSNGGGGRAAMRGERPPSDAQQSVGAGTWAENAVMLGACCAVLMGGLFLARRRPKR